MKKRQRGTSSTRRRIKTLLPRTHEIKKRIRPKLKATRNFDSTKIALKHDTRSTRSRNGKSKPINGTSQPSPIFPTVGKMECLIEKAKQLLAQIKRREKSIRTEQKYLTAEKWKYGQILAAIKVKSKKHKGDWGKALTAIGETYQRAEENIKIASYFKSAEEAGKFPVRPAINLFRKADSGSGGIAFEADQLPIEASGEPLTLDVVPDDNDDAGLLPDPTSNGKIPYVFRGGNSSNPRPNTIPTPPGICQFIHDLISPHYPTKTVLDPCSGTGALTKPWQDVTVIAFEIMDGKDFFDCPSAIECNLTICNSPFNSDGIRSFPPERFFRRILEVVPSGSPIVFFAPMTFRLDQTRGSSRWRWLRDECPAITSIITLPHDAFGHGKVHSEILLFNMPKLKPHYFVPDKYLR